MENCALKLDMKINLNDKIWRENLTKTYLNIDASGKNCELAYKGQSVRASLFPGLLLPTPLDL
jgi:hypothetical protein